MGSMLEQGVAKSKCASSSTGHVCPGGPALVHYRPPRRYAQHSTQPQPTKGTCDTMDATSACGSKVFSSTSRWASCSGSAANAASSLGCTRMGALKLADGS